LGKIKEILSPGANDVWVVARPGKSDLLLPKIDQVIKRVDLDQGEVIVELMEGLD
ncbi:MAG: ribosome maturation factor RimM, partial [Levilactobacillus brevis]